MANAGAGNDVCCSLALLRKSVGGPQSAFEGIWLRDTLSLRPSERGEAVEDGGADLHFGDLAIEVSCHDALAQQFEAMHFCFDQAALVIAAPSFPDRPAEPVACTNNFIASRNARRISGPCLRIAAGGDDGTGIACGNGFVTGSCVESTIGTDARDGLIAWYLLQQFGQHGRVANPASGHFDSADLQRSEGHTQVDLSPLAAFGRTMLAPAPFPVTHRLDARAVDQQVQRSGTGLTGDLDKQGLLPPAQGTEIRHRPIETGHLKKAYDHAGGLAQGKLEHSLERQAGLDRGIREDRLTPTLAGWRRQPLHPGIKPDVKRTSLRQRCIVGLPVRRAVACAGRFAHSGPLTDWIHERNPSVICATKPNQPSNTGSK